LLLENSQCFVDLLTQFKGNKQGDAGLHGRTMRGMRVTRSADELRVRELDKTARPDDVVMTSH
jgi:hypothetical protein